MQIHELNTRTPGVYDYAALDTGSQTYKAKVGDLKPQYVSYDSANPTSWAEVATMGSNTPISTFFERVTYIARNVRYLWKLIGSGDFSNVSETISGAIGNTALTTTATDISGAIAEHESDISTIEEDISTINGNLTKKLIVDHSNEYTIKSGDSLNDYTESGVYNCTSASIAQTLTGKPSAITTGFKLVCMTAGYNSIIAYGLQIIFAGSGTGTPRIFVRSGKTGGDWSQWYQVSTTTVS